jgi:hypothetical protein
MSGRGPTSYQLGDAARASNWPYTKDSKLARVTAVFVLPAVLRAGNGVAVGHVRHVASLNLSEPPTNSISDVSATTIEPHTRPPRRE